LANKLANEIECLNRKDLEDLYHLYWNDGECWSNDDLKQHLLRYTLMFWQMRSFKASMKDRSKHIINEIHKKYKEKES
jgi:hypothetical protein